MAAFYFQNMSLPIEPYLQHIGDGDGDGAAVPVVLQMLGLVDLGDEAGAVEHLAVVATVAHRAAVDAILPLGLLLPCKILGLAKVGGVIDGERSEIHLPGCR